MSILDATTAPTLKGNIENESIPREQAEQMLQDLINDMNDQNFDSIKYASYRTGAKLSFIMSKTNLNLVDIYNMIEAFRENGLHILDHDSEIHESRLEAVLSSIFYALNKRIPSTTDIDVERCIALVKHWLLYAYDSDANDRIRVLSVKASLSMLCSGRQVDKLRYVFSQVSEQNGKLNFTKFDGYLKEILKLPEAVGESPTFGYNDDVVNSFFRPTGPLRQDATTLEHFLDCILASDPPPSLLWLTAFHKIVHASRAKHDVACKVCKKSSFKGLRYKCLRCVGYTLCQDCFWRGRVAGSHSVEHDTREYSTWNEGEKGTRLSAGKISDPLPPKVPDYPEEPNPDQTMDMTHIVPSIQNDYSAMNGVSHSTPSSSGKLSDPDSSDSRMDDEHKLIARYAARLAESTDGAPNAKKTSAELREDLEQNKAKRKIINDLQLKNRELLEEIRNLREVREAAADQPNGTTVDPAQLEELKGLRQKKDELELRMSALQETRKELMSQLEGLMSILKAGSPRTRSTPNSPSTVPRNLDYNARSPSDRTPGHSSVHGKGHPSHQGRNLRNDLMHAADNVTNAMSSLVNELTSEDDDDDLNNNIRSNGMPPMITADHTSRPIPAEG